ncbi:MAG: hypothetical protein OXG62_06065 [Nitrospinae bacterium]|nr:hypothetical protein [Nitrospinota bacterium]
MPVLTKDDHGGRDNREEGLSFYKTIAPAHAAWPSILLAPEAGFFNKPLEVQGRVCRPETGRMNYPETV